MAITRARLRRMARRETIGVDVAAAMNLVGALTRYLSLAFLFPLAIAIWHDESPWPFVFAAAITLAVGSAIAAGTRGKERVGLREGFLVVALTWVFAAGAGALPYLLADEPQLASPLDAYFESMSGFSTTGASVLTDIEALDRSLLMWRQFTQWLGGMGIIVLALAVLPRLRVGGRQLFESEAPGPEHEPLAASIRDTARRLWTLYLLLTIACAAAFTAAGWAGYDDEMDLYDGVAHALSTLPTGGFSPHAEGFGAFDAATQWVAVVFMLVAGINFALLYLVLIRGRLGVLWRDEELRAYVALATLGVAVVFVVLLGDDIFNGEAALRHASFQAVSMMTTTGAASVDFAAWPVLAAMTLVALMFVGGSAGSTAGSVKVVRHLFIGRVLRRELDQTVHPEAVLPLRLNGRAIDEKTVGAVIAFVLLYVGLFVAGAGLIAIDSTFAGVDVDAFDAIAASATTLGNVGPAFGFAGPYGSFDPFTDSSKLVMIALMWLGRLELIPVLVLFTRQYWRA